MTISYLSDHWVKKQSLEINLMLIVKIHLVVKNKWLIILTKLMFISLSSQKEKVVIH